MFWYNKRIEQLEKIVFDINIERSIMKKEIDIIKMQQMIQWTKYKLYVGNTIFPYSHWPIYIIYKEEWEKNYVIEWKPVNLLREFTSASKAINHIECLIRSEEVLHEVSSKK